MTTVYYAHPMSWYGTDQERADLQALSLEYEKIINPADQSVKLALGIWQAGHPEHDDIMSFFNALVRSSDAVAYRPFSDGKLGAGVAREVLEGHIHGKELIRLYSGTCGPLCGPVKMLVHDGAKPDLLWHTLTIEETRSRVGRKML